jgi:hypothetical protein
MYGDRKLAPIKATQGKIHDFLAMKLDFTTEEKLKVEMTDYIKNMINDFPSDLMKCKRARPDIQPAIAFLTTRV